MFYCNKLSIYLSIYLVLSKKLLVSGNKLLKISNRLLIRIVNKIFLQRIFFLARLLPRKIFLVRLLAKNVFLNYIIHSMDDSSYRLNFDLGKKNEIHHYS